MSSSPIDWSAIPPWTVQRHSDESFVVKIDAAPERTSDELYADSSVRLIGFRSPKSRLVGYQLVLLSSLQVWEGPYYVGLFRNVKALNLSPKVVYNDQNVQLRSFQANRSHNYTFAIRWR